MMGYLLDTNAISESFRRRPNLDFSRWLRALPRSQQFTSTVVIYELYVAAYRAQNSKKWFRRIEDEVLPVVTVLPFDLGCARVCGRLQADLMQRGTTLDAPDVQIAATALHHGLSVVTGNVRHFEKIPDLPLLTFQPGEEGSFGRV